MFRMLLPITGIVAVLATGTVHGLWTDRWKLSDEPGASAARLSQVPLKLPDWDGQVAGDRKPKDATAAVELRYVHNRTGKVVTVYLVCGRAGPISIHTPDVCYTGAGYDMLSPPLHHAPPLGANAPEAAFLTAPFCKKKAAEHTYLRIFWAWSGTGDWSAPEDPRFAFAHHPALFKIYLNREMAVPDEPLDDDPCVELMRQLLPALQQTLFPS